MDVIEGLVHELEVEKSKQLLWAAPNYSRNKGPCPQSIGGER